MHDDRTYTHYSTWLHTSRGSYGHGINIRAYGFEFVRGTVAGGLYVDYQR